jgi:hypothetical protein
MTWEPPSILQNLRQLLLFGLAISREQEFFQIVKFQRQKRRPET